MQDAEQFVADFIDFWNDPSPQRIPEILHPDVVLTQPLAAPMRGIAAVQEEFRRIWRFLPDLHVQVDRWRGDGDVLFIELRLRAHAGGELVEWPGIDRFVLRDGKAVQRMTYFDPLPVLAKVVKHPSLWWRWWVSGAARPWRTGHLVTDYTALTQGVD
ncbi:MULTISPECIES: nuclear transport factor 2 family protein [Actinomadura]|uniref:Nuclear transport factor 2 family protein n=1 Tax=Actinomadura yumaensis TaxID=111807 RepID=A0ABW2CKG7_9ACTN|nr:nuclear transport factor 2 family protein [Actinomadura sp. J1-007]MWK37102.1 nuclear transport factor 2 family protein [Actinomadura sp. J1-007]